MLEIQIKYSYKRQEMFENVRTSKLMRKKVRKET
jgi:hypothetical protein